MNVSGVNGNTYPNGVGQSNPQIKAIDKQIAGIRKSIQDVKANKELDEKSKTDKIKEYEQQITLLQQQKSQIQAEERKPKQVDESQNAPNDEAARETEESKGAAMQETTQKSLIQMDSAVKSGQKLGVVRTELENKLRIAESDSYFSRSDPGKAAEYRAKINNIDNEVIKKSTNAIENMQEGNETGNTSGVKTAAEEEDEAGTAERIAREANPDEQERRGTGRFGAGQFLYEEA